MPHSWKRHLSTARWSCFSLMLLGFLCMNTNWSTSTMLKTWKLYEQELGEKKNFFRSGEKLLLLFCPEIITKHLTCGIDNSIGYLIESIVRTLWLLVWKTASVNCPLYICDISIFVIANLVHCCYKTCRMWFISKKLKNKTRKY